MAQDPKKDDGKEVYISGNGLVSSTPQEAIETSLIFEDTSGTGAGCSQTPDNVPAKE